MKIRYEARPGSFFNDEDAQAYGAFLTKLQAEGDGVLLTANIVEAAKPEESPIHKEFEWDDSYAADLYRMEQARRLARNIVRVELVDGEEKRIRAFVNVDFSEDDSPGNKTAYIDIETVARSPRMREQIIKRALAELVRWKKQYAGYQELEEIFGLIEKVQSRLFSKPEKEARP